MARTETAAKRRGLPKHAGLKHERHYVEELVGRATTNEPRLSFLKLDEVRPNPSQPRKDFDDLDDLTRSVREKGVLEPVLVKADGTGYVLIAGERRYRAARLAGLSQIPALVLVPKGEDEALEIALIENLQRKDLSAFEEADGLKALRDRYGYTHETIAQRISKSRTAVTESLKLADVPAPVRAACERAGIQSKSVLLEVAKQASTAGMFGTVERLAEGGVKREELRRERRPSGAGRPKNFVFKYGNAARGASLELKFNRARVSPAEVIETLTALIDEIRRSEKR